VFGRSVSSAEPVAPSSRSTISTPPFGPVSRAPDESSLAAQSVGYAKAMPRRALVKVSDACLTPLGPASIAPAASSPAWRASRISLERSGPSAGSAARTETGTHRIRSRPQALFTVPVRDPGQASGSMPGRADRGGGVACPAAPPPLPRGSRSIFARCASRPSFDSASRSRYLPRSRRPARAYPTRRCRADPSHRPQPTCSRPGNRPGSGCSPPPGWASTTS
jgi:hypothetical protein